MRRRRQPDPLAVELANTTLEKERCEATILFGSRARGDPPRALGHRPAGARISPPLRRGVHRTQQARPRARQQDIPGARPSTTRSDGADAHRNLPADETDPEPHSRAGRPAGLHRRPDPGAVSRRTGRHHPRTPGRQTTGAHIPHPSPTSPTGPESTTGKTNRAAGRRQATRPSAPRRLFRE